MILVLILPKVDAVLPAVEAAEEIPLVEMIQVEMDGTVVIAIAPTKKETMTNPKDRMPFPAIHDSFSRTAASESFKRDSYLEISCSNAHSCSSPVIYKTKKAIPTYRLTETNLAIQVEKASLKAGNTLTAKENGPSMTNTVE